MLVSKKKIKSAPSPSSRRKEEPLPFQKVTQTFLRSVTKDPLESITFIDLSRCGIKRVTGLYACVNIEVVILQGNIIDTLLDMSGCPHLWKLDVSCNELKDLCGFEKFKTFGTLAISGNQFDWLELSKISHLEILSLYLTGNPKLKKDPNYRRHVIKCLSKVWSIDGELVTADERAKVALFFQKAARTDKPVRLKLPNQQFVPTFMKHESRSSVFGRRTISMSKHFGKNEVHNCALDKRRLQYLNKNINDDFMLESCLETQNDSIPKLFLMRNQNVEKWNMFLLLLISSLVFAIPRPLLMSVLEVIGMADTEITICYDILNLPLQTRTNVVSLLFSSVKLNGICNGITTQLYETIKALNQGLVEVAYGENDVQINPIYHHTIAAEVVHLFCLVPNFSVYLSDQSVLNILFSATLNDNIEEEIKEQVCRCKGYKSKESLLELITVQIKRAKQSNDFLFNDHLKEWPNWHSGWRKTRSHLIRGLTRPATAPPLTDVGAKYEINPVVGDKVLLGPQRLAHVISVPDVKVVLVQVDSLPSSKYLQADYVEPIQNEQSLFYINKNDLQWNQQFGSWIKESFHKTSRSQKGNHVTSKRPGLVLQRSQDYSMHRSTAASYISGIKSDVKAHKREKPLHCQSAMGLRGSSNFCSRKNSIYQEECENDVNPVPELKNQDFPTEYKVLQANVYHLYQINKPVHLPMTTLTLRPQTSRTRRSDSSFIRKSNWLSSVGGNPARWNH